MSKRKAATASKHARSPKIAAKAQRANQAIVRSPKDSRLRSVTAVSSPKRHKDSKQEAPLVESPAAALPDDFKQTMRDNDSNKGFDFSSASSATASVRTYQASCWKWHKPTCNLRLNSPRGLRRLGRP
jgi:hypothetical protein